MHAFSSIVIGASEADLVEPELYHTNTYGNSQDQWFSTFGLRPLWRGGSNDPFTGSPKTLGKQIFILQFITVAKL